MARLQIGHRTIEAKAVVFDKDGTLIDFNMMWGQIIAMRAQMMVTAPGVDPAWQQELIRAMGIDPDAKTVHPRGPVAIAPRAEVMLAAVTVLYLHGIAWDEAKQIVEKAFTEADQRLKLADMIRPIPGMVETLQALKKAGVKVVIGTTDNAEKARANLPYLGITELVDLVVGGDSVRHSKPDPEMLYLICRRLNISPKDVVMVGDAVTDVRMGRNAGVGLAVGVLTGVTSQAALAGEADVVVDSVAAIKVIEQGDLLPFAATAEDVPKARKEPLVIYADGGSRGNPGDAGIGAVIYDSQQHVLKEISGYIVIKTNNEAEYTALITALREALKISTGELQIYLDSDLLVKQINGEYRVKNARLSELYAELMKLLHRFDTFKVTHVRREYNKEADRLANLGMDSKAEYRG